jgi:CO dehydrogenase maturation factor
MKIAVAGKGGSGKTTIAATLARLLARRGRQVLAVDADSNPNLAVTLGLARDQAASLETVPREVLQDVANPDGTTSRRLAVPPAQVAARWGVRAPDGVTLLVMGRVSHAGSG